MIKTPHKLEIYPHWYKRCPASPDHRESEIRVQARLKLYEVLKQIQEKIDHYLAQNIEHIYDEVDDSENIILNPLLIEQNPKLKSLFPAAGFELVTETPAEHKHKEEEKAEFKERILKGSNMNRKLDS